ncbi:metal-dependent hydrolase [Tenacibaculum sp.]|nr:metal-dependent hydrolase [Tenacibaculum sp.]
MDSLTQIVLGAACGEMVLGKKIGNRAILFGAIGGTIPDLDVVLGSLFYSNEIDKLAFHRGFMHSIVFAILASVIIGVIVYKLYDSKGRKGMTTVKDWINLFLLSILTHPLLDSFTPYGTQLFLPFSDYRVAFNNISVIDLLYTLPFLICLTIAMFYNRKDKRRRLWAKSGVYISSIYMLFTLGNKLYMDTVFERSFKKAKINYTRYSIQPTILNNFLWYGIAETEDSYEVAFYSLFDKDNYAKKIIRLPKNHELLDMNEPDLKTLAWFSNDYYNLKILDSSKNIRYNDLRYPILNEENVNSSVFSFELTKKNDRWQSSQYVDESVERVSISSVLHYLWNRMKGI